MTAPFGIQEIPEEKYKHLEWTKEEEVYQKRKTFLTEYEVPISAAIQIKLKRSVFGIHLKSFNENQTQSRDFNESKFHITNWEMRNFSNVKDELLKNNYVSHNLYNLLERAVKERECIDWDFLYENMEDMRIYDFHITLIDSPLLMFKNLRILSLCGNWIEHINGFYLPRTLELLECFANSISNVESLCQSPPKGLLYIGLSRNKFTNDCKFGCFQNNKFQFLKCLDLSDNDIYMLLDVLQPVSILPSLYNLILEGNPCATCSAYKDAVLQYLPDLGYLDSVEILQKDRRIKKFDGDELLNGVFTFTCHRIIGLPAPPKLKGIQHTIHVEVTLPLLEEEIRDEEVFVIGENLENEEQPTMPKRSRKRNKTKKTEKIKRGKSKDKSYYDAEDEYVYEQKRKSKNPSFKTNRMQWSNVIEMPEEYQIASPEENLFALRDTFRSKINVKVIYLMIQPPQKPKIKNKKQKRKKDKQDESQEEAGTEEIILKKVTLASFYCKMYNINWSDKTIDYYWTDSPKCHPYAIPVEGSLRAINYISGKPPNPKKGKTPIKKITGKEYLPNKFTCQMGFGLKRLY